MLSLRIKLVLGMWRSRGFKPITDDTWEIRYGAQKLITPRFPAYVSLSPSSVYRGLYSDNGDVKPKTSFNETSRRHINDHHFSSEAFTAMPLKLTLDEGNSQEIRKCVFGWVV